MRSDRAAIEATELATSGVDYANVSSGVVSFDAGQTVGWATIDVYRDDIPELTESFAVDLFQPYSFIKSPTMT